MAHEPIRPEAPKFGKKPYEKPKLTPTKIGKEVTYDFGGRIYNLRLPSVLKLVDGKPRYVAIDEHGKERPEIPLDEFGNPTKNGRRKA